MDYFNQKIKCDVKECKYNAKMDHKCTLGKIEISGANNKFDTFCASFEDEQNKN